VVGGGVRFSKNNLVDKKMLKWILILLAVAATASEMINPNSRTRTVL
jgi:hypothetical protein